MKKLFIIANWKSNKTTDEAIAWIQTINNSQLTFNKDEKEIIVCPSFTSLPSMKAYILQKSLPIKLGAQDISPFGDGAYTGEVSAKQIKELAEYVLIGHSERRSLGENDELLSKKADQALVNGLAPIFFMQGVDTHVPNGVRVVVYEPPNAISTVSHGVPVSPQDVGRAARAIKQNHPDVHILYGGSVDPGNVSEFSAISEIEGVVPGHASLDAEEFMEIIRNS